MPCLAEAQETENDWRRTEEVQLKMLEFETDDLDSSLSRRNTRTPISVFSGIIPNRLRSGWEWLKSWVNYSKDSSATASRKRRATDTSSEQEEWSDCETSPPPAKKRSVPPLEGFEYLDHPADVQIHSWGPKLETALEQAVLAMYGYMTDLEGIENVFDYHMEATASGPDISSMVCSVMEEALTGFQSEPFFVGNKVMIDQIDLKNSTINFRASGECFDIKKHRQGSDVKAITYSNMQIHLKPERVDIYVIIDI